MNATHDRPSTKLVQDARGILVNAGKGSFIMKLSAPHATEKSRRYPECQESQLHQRVPRTRLATMRDVALFHRITEGSGLLAVNQSAHTAAAM